jgi:poly(A) polymerase
LADDGVREDLLQQVRSEQQKVQRSPRVHSVKRASKSPSANGASSNNGETPDPRFRDADNNNNQDDLNDDDMHGDAAPAKKRRRRRRKPSGGSGSAPTTD